MDLVHEAGDYPEVYVGYPGAGKGIVGVQFIAKKAEQAFGFKFRELREISLDTLAAFREQGL